MKFIDLICRGVRVYHYINRLTLIDELLSLCSEFNHINLRNFREGLEDRFLSIDK